MSAKINKHGVKAPVKPKSEMVTVKAYARTRPLSKTVANKAAKHRAAFEKLAKT